MRGDRERLLDIAQAIERIEKYAQRGRQAFESDELIQTWVLHHLQIIGEASRELSENTKAGHPEMPWQDIVGMRNILVHRYFAVDTELVWAAVQDDLPVLKRKIAAMLAEVGTES